ncbi:BamA/TamA family outer membrane protein [Pedobacter flavus]|uniref:BamA/TamA family outer membrane protein n=1 Tax=Pedobacter flavus TaxID=3113906 RepID=A0ABU7H1Q3_9SPHI|nr:BamA/TamA family outer membrane protein [Pedobacter sp. VNH31]MEE1885219.1 BamA/TamA family outer membrane protein [Pedobacter sp. VNH31]
MILKAYTKLLSANLPFYAILLIIIVFFAACSSTQYIEPYQSIVKKVRIDSIENQYEEAAYDYVQKDIRPASKLSINVLIYNMFNTKDGKYKTSGIKQLGSAPPILDSTLVEISRTQIEKYLKSKGYFNAKVGSEVKVENKKATIIYKANPGIPYQINKIDFTIPDTVVKALYFDEKALFSNLKEGMQFDEDSLSHEVEQIYQMMKRNGYYDFLRPYISFEVDSALKNYKVNLNLQIDNPKNKSRHTVFNIGDADFLIAPNSEGFVDTPTLSNDLQNGIRFTDLSGRFKRGPIVKYDFLFKGDVYDINKEKLTYDRLYELNVFKNVKIDYLKASDSSNTLDPIITLIPQKRMSNRIEGEVPFNSGSVGFSVSNTYTNNNLFKGAERFEFQIKGGLQSRIGQNTSLFKDVYQRDFSVSTKLTIPRLLLPFSLGTMGRNGMPFTTISTSYLFALQKDFSRRRVFLNSISYDWVETKNKLHSVTPLNFEYRFGDLLLDTNTVSGKAILNANSYNIQLLDRKDLTLGIKYTFSYNFNRLNQLNNFVYFRGNLDIAGNLLGLISKLGGSSSNPTQGIYSTVFGLPYNQYIRPEFDFRVYKSLGGNHQFIVRLNAGAGIAYGNSRSMPFEKLFYAGGAGGIRAWQARTLGPGNYNRDIIPTDSLRRTFYGLDQLGEMRIEANMEYRYLLINKFFGGQLKGATFVDAGNVWNIGKSNANPETFFNFNKLGSQIALGIGSGVRYDVKYFIFRFDVGLKLKDPQFQPGKQWVIGDFLKGGRDFKDAYYLTHSPERYRFIQYNFGIGMPF